MTTRLRVKFDGSVLVPQEPVDWTAGDEFEVERQQQSDPDRTGMSDLQQLASKLASYPPADLPADYSVQIDHYLYGAPKRDNP